MIKKALFLFITMILIGTFAVGFGQTKSTDGNTMGNIVNGGLVVADRDWIYFAYGTDTVKNDELIYRMTPQKVNVKKLLVENKAHYLNICGPWIYYSNLSNRIGSDGGKLYKVKIDGTQNIRVTDDDAKYTNLVNGVFYYINEDQKIKSVDIHGTNNRVISNDRCSEINVVNEWIYYGNSSDGGALYKIKTDGTSRIRLSKDDCDFINVIGNWVYYVNYSDENRIYKISIDGKERKRISTVSASCINVDSKEGFIYFTNFSDMEKLYRIKTDGTGLKKVGDDRSYDINLVGPWVYYNRVFAEHSELYRVLKDGTCQQRL